MGGVELFHRVHVSRVVLSRLEGRRVHDPSPSETVMWRKITPKCREMLEVFGRYHVRPDIPPLLDSAHP